MPITEPKLNALTDGITKGIGEAFKPLIAQLERRIAELERQMKERGR